MKWYRKKNGLTQEKLAERAGITANYIALIETGKSFPSLTTVNKIAEALNITNIELFNSKSLNYPKKEKFTKFLLERIKETVIDVFENNDID
jgi:transcriptional regulator with XRE-family HTH domain